MNKDLTRRITNIAGKVCNAGGFLLIFVAGMLFLLLADLELNVRSPWLFFSIVLALGAVICLIIANKYREKPKTMYILKSAGIALTACFIVYILIFLDAAYSSKIQANSEEFKLNIFAIEEVFGKKMINLFYDVCMSTVIIAAIALAMQIADVVLTALHKVED